MWETFVNHIQVSANTIINTAQLFYQGVVSNISILALIDIALVFGLLWWIYKKLRRTDLIKILPKIFILLLLVLVARILGLWVFFYLSAGLFVIVMIALGALYAPEIKKVLETDYTLPTRHVTKSAPSTAEIQTTIKILVEAFSVLAKAKKPALVALQVDKPLSRLLESDARMQANLTIEALIDFFGNGSELAKGAAVVDGSRIIAAGSKLGAKKKLLFNEDNPHIKRIAKEFGAVIIIANKTTGEIAVLHDDHVYKRLSPKDLSQVLQTVLVYS
ncbi:MAG: diadenylate cyclase [Patescibacteria group bacterium]|nr:diadenylate cyclase [Patescibacteria group bacterium]